ncbi:phosphate acyltransferase PlsX [Agarivorans sp. Alg241-V36]|uniref:phosphate acyltransferase PlsX n=1 Tax=Agarivorans sp. Alg241-V36 TaxID=2305992 RepID=UPI0013D5E454|nr:phosphate acyltransferase PlsX [Agarivorans sp. Alg241-V36]
MQKLTIAVDAMGGDVGPHVTVPAVAQALNYYPHLHVTLIGDKHFINSLLIEQQISQHPRLEFVHSSQVVSANDKPITALRSRRQSSMRLALDLVHQQQADACVSAGNTGALMAMAKVVLKLLPGIERPALVTHLPEENGQGSLLLDLGANSSCDSEVLMQFAVMGASLAESVWGLPKPRVALLNIGEEQIKGNDVVKQTAQLLENSSAINYIGFVEGNQIFSGKADVIVCDGFVGNVALKTAEGVSQLILAKLKKQFDVNWFARFILKLFLPSLKSQLKQLNPDQYNGASLLGLRGIVIKSHGHADEKAFLQAIHQAVAEIQQQVPSRITDKLESLLIDKH